MTGNPPANSGPAGKANAASGGKGDPNQQGSSKRNRFGWLGGLISGVISGALVSIALTPTGHAMGVYAFRVDPVPNCSNPQWLMQVPDDQIFSDSYYFSPDTLPYYGILHVPDSSTDSNLRSSWLQWWPTTNMNGGNQSDNWISWSFPHKYDIRLICVINGWTEDNNTYQSALPIGKATIYSNYASNFKVKDYQLCPPITAHLADFINNYTYQWQAVPFGCATNSITLQIDNVDETSVKARTGHLDMVPEPPPNNKIKAPLVGLSEVRFYYAPAILSHLPSRLK